MQINNTLSTPLRSVDGIACATIYALIIGNNNVGPIGQKIVA